jgi:hypothetical protein
LAAAAMPRPPAWLVYPLAVLVLTLAALELRERAGAPPAPPPLTAPEGAALAQGAPFDLLSILRVRRGFGGTMGTAFSVGDNGVWLATGSVTQACAHPALLLGAGQGVGARARPGPVGELAVLTTPAGGAPALPLAARTPPLAAPGFVAGFPQGRPGELALRLLGTQTLFLPGRRAHPLPVLVWAEIGRTDGLGGALIGIAGAPALDGEGRVVGVVLGESPRRGRIYTTTPQATAQALAAAGVRTASGAAGEPITRDNYGLAADDLRRSYRVAPLVCARA